MLVGLLLYWFRIHYEYDQAKDDIAWDFGKAIADGGDNMDLGGRMISDSVE